MIAAVLGLLLGGVVLGAMASGGGGRSSSVAAEPHGGDEPLVPPPEPTSSTARPELAAETYALSWAGLTAEEQLIVELINRARKDPQDEATRLSDDLASGSSNTMVEALAVVEALSDAARGHSQDMDNRAFFDHINPDLENPADRAVDAGHSTRYVGENIGYIGSTWAPNPQVRAEQHHENLWASDGHQRNLLSDNWSEIGVGYDYGDHNGYNHATFVTEKFSDTGKSYLTGVVIDDHDDDDFYDIGEGQGGVRITAYNDEGAHGTATWEAGGYTLELPPGTYTVAFEGDTLDSIYEAEVTIGNENVKLDLIEDGSGATVATLSAIPSPSEAETLMAAITSDFAEIIEDPTQMEDEDLALAELMV